ncbi:NO-inducible flavohemoprotein [Fodinicurvata sp. EGI_FJ10296]|uniref:NO-inducible flavohemoprotein n=1 Tax=Fodinicurvata sp. EGI_FJ10296 TaxID=3231908 RepID=UPI0034513EDD
MPSPLSSRTVEIIKATAPVLETHGLDIVHAMYGRMFKNPEIRDMFNQSHQGDDSQPRALTGAILAYAQNIDNLDALVPVVERIAQKHVGLQILPEHYPHVGQALLDGMTDVLGDAATEEIIGAWHEAYWFLANILIERERKLYEDIAGADGGWTGWRAFVIEASRRESDVIRSFQLRPVDGMPVLRHKAGQYLTFAFDIPESGTVKRNYSISTAPNGETYRISVKRESGGLASNWLHDQALPGTVLNAAPPAGDFFLPDTPADPIVLLSGGVGLTPMVAMLETVAKDHPGTPVHFVHGAIDGSTHAMGDHVRALASDQPGLTTTVFYQSPRPEDISEQRFDQQGLIDRNWLAANTDIKRASYFVCGPRAFMQAMINHLTALGVPASRIHYEFFGPADALLAA